MHFLEYLSMGAICVIGFEWLVKHQEKKLSLN